MRTRQNETVKAARFFDVDVDGLAHDWPGRIYMNPPYCHQAGPFVARLLDQYKRGITTAAILCLNGNSTDTTWFKPLFDFPLCFAGRIAFLSPNGPSTGATHGSVFAYVGPHRERFVEVFSQFGPVEGRIDRSRGFVPRAAQSGSPVIS